MNIVYILKPSIEIYPPCVSQILTIKDLGYRIEVWYGHCAKPTLELLRENGVVARKFSYPPDSNNSVIGKVKNWAAYRHCILAAMRECDVDETVFWFGTAESAIPLYPLSNRYRMVLSVLELMDTRSISRRFTASIARKCTAVTACQSDRAYIMKSWWKLSSLPYVLPNKPYKIDIEKNAQCTCPETVDAISRVGQRKFIIYQGIFQNVEYISAIAEALRRLDSDIYLVMMGSDRRGIVPMIEKIYKKTVYIEHISSPKHLEITSHALLGVVCYDHTSLNKLYCAPNKIFEYSKFSIPMIGNDVPGLINSIGASGAGVCVPFTENKVYEALIELLQNYDEYARAAGKFFESVDNKETVRRLLRRVEDGNRGAYVNGDLYGES